jgi:hypothetical protein
MTLNEVIIPSFDQKFCPETRVKIQTQNVSSTFIIKFFAPFSENLKNVIFNKNQIEVVISSLGFSMITNFKKKRKELMYFSLEDLHFRQMTSQRSTDTLFTLGKFSLENPFSHKPVFPKILSTSVSNRKSKFSRFLDLFQKSKVKKYKSKSDDLWKHVSGKKFLELKVGLL